MDNKLFFSYLIIMAGVTYLVRTVPLLVFRKKIENRFVKSFLFYMPYAVLGSMTFPAIIYSTGDIVSGIVGMLTGAGLAFKNKSLLTVAAAACAAALAVKLIGRLM
ncbi:MAG: AzlD domain-containing protein [Clostridia bacterium]|nr:AzlD domain-containing protein [Clostridia bacterium]